MRDREQSTTLAQSKWTAQVALVLRPAADYEDDAEDDDVAGVRSDLCRCLRFPFAHCTSS